MYQRIRDGDDISDMTRYERESSSPIPGLLTAAGALVSVGSPFGTGNTESPFTARERAVSGSALILDGAAHADSSYLKLVASRGGTAVRPFQPYQEAEDIAVPKPSRWVAYQHILFQPEYRDRSIEELRFADYLLGRCNRNRNHNRNHNRNRNRDGIGLDKGGMGVGVGSLGGHLFDHTGVTTTTTTTAGLGLYSTRDTGHLGPWMTSCDDDAAASDNYCPGTSIASFKAATEDDPVRRGEKVAYQHILFQDVYWHWSTEELRLADYKRTQHLGTVVGPNVACSGLGLEGRFRF